MIVSLKENPILLYLLSYPLTSFMDYTIETSFTWLSFLKWCHNPDTWTVI
jgi:hypothetical protein